MKNQMVAFMATLLTVGSIVSCTQNQKTNTSHAEVFTESRESHKRDFEGGEGEEDGAMYASNYEYDKVTKGVRLKLGYDEEQRNFTGSIENTTKETLDQIRVEIHLSNGQELGPTAPTSLTPGEIKDISLDASGQEFQTWSTHPEIGRGEHEHGIDNEHGEKGHDRKKGEHGEHGKKKNREHS